VLLVGGFASGCCDEGPNLQARSNAIYVEQFSYLGLTEQGDPLPHTGLVTDADLSRMARLMAAQVENLAEQSGGPVAVVAESEGTLVAAAYLQQHPAAPVDRLMLLSPIIEPGRVTYPDPGEEGRGVVAGYQLRVISELIDEMAPFTISADSALVDSVRREAADLQAALLGDHPRIEEVAVLPLADAVTGPGDSEFAIEVIVVPGFHGGLRGRPDVQAMIRSWVLGEDLEGSRIWLTVNWVIAGSASAWQVPGLDSLAYSSG
jgi:pimeloyl-ACP methyl ester carboxylesterase